MLNISFCCYWHSVFNTSVQLTEGRSARDQPKQLPAKKKTLSYFRRTDDLQAHATTRVHGTEFGGYGAKQYHFLFSPDTHDIRSPFGSSLWLKLFRFKSARANTYSRLVALVDQETE